MANEPIDITESTVDLIVRLGKEAKARADESKAEYDLWRKNTERLMLEADDKVWATPYGTVTIVEATERPELNWDGLLNELDDGQRAMVTKTVPVEAKLEAAVELGAISPELVAKYVEMVPGRKAHLRYDPKRTIDTDGEA